MSCVGDASSSSRYPRPSFVWLRASQYWVRAAASRSPASGSPKSMARRMTARMLSSSRSRVSQPGPLIRSAKMLGGLLGEIQEERGVPSGHLGLFTGGFEPFSGVLVNGLEHRHAQLASGFVAVQQALVVQ